jgi:hypothetical protein
MKNQLFYCYKKVYVNKQDKLKMRSNQNWLHLANYVPRIHYQKLWGN